MTDSILDRICPRYIGEDRIDVGVTNPEATKRANQAVRIEVRLDRCEPDGVVEPLEIVVQGPSEQSYERHIRNEAASEPSAGDPWFTFSFVPKEGGQHMVMVRECYHNQHWGRVTFAVDGERLEV